MIACARHPSAAAGWQCGGCGEALCPQCAGFRKAGYGRIEVCLGCGGLATVLRERRAVLRPFDAATLRGAVRWPFSRDGLLSAVACAVVLWVLGKGGVMGALSAEGLVVSILFRVTVSTARGADGFQGADDFRGFFQDILGPLFRALVASIWAWGPFVLWVSFHGGFFRNGDPLQLTELTSVVPVLLLLIGTFFFPMALLAGALETPLQQLLNPLVVVGYAVRLGRDYLLLSAFCLGISLAESILLQLLGFIDDHVLGLPQLVQLTALLFPPLMLFRALGLLVRARGDELGYGGEASYLEPVLGDVQPATELLAKDRDEMLREQLGRAAPENAAETPGGWAEPRAPEAEHSEPAAAGEASSGLELGGHAAGETHGESALSGEAMFEAPAPAGEAGHALARKVTEGTFAGAVALLASAGPSVPATLLSARSWTDLGRACLAGQRADLAVVALRRAVEIAPAGPLAPQALLQAARVLDEKLHDRAGSDLVLRELLERHPGSPEARFAARRLAGG